jgi:hypothetical protein
MTTLNLLENKIIFLVNERDETMKEANKNVRQFFPCIALALLIIEINSNIFAQQVLGSSVGSESSP